MTRNIASIVFVLAACGPSQPGESAGGTGTGAGTAGSTDAATTTDVTTTDVTTSTVTSTAAGSTGADSPGEPDLPPETCPWYWPENEGLRFCPAPAEGGTEVVGTGPSGPVSFKFALFGLQQCASCPSPESPALWLYAEVPGDDTMSPAGDFIAIHLWEDEVQDVHGKVAGEWVGLGNDDVIVEFTATPTVEETSPPFDEAAPPAMSGNLKIEADGWLLGGSFTANLCSDLWWAIACE